MYYHDSIVGGITVLEPRISNHLAPLIYVSQERESVVVFQRMAVADSEKVCG